jgi:hypothetical protein
MVQIMTRITGFCFLSLFPLKSLSQSLIAEAGYARVTTNAGFDAS